MRHAKTTQTIHKKIASKDEAIKKLCSRDNDLDLDLEVRDVPNKGRGVFTKREFKEGELVVEYVGDLINLKEANRRERDYEEQDHSMKGYMFYFQAQRKSYCLDATRESDRLGRLINHSCKHPNVKPKLHIVEGTPKLIFIATCDIPSQQELLFDYGEKRKDVLDENPWLKE